MDPYREVSINGNTKKWAVYSGKSYWNKDFLKWCTSKLLMLYNGVFHYKPPILGSPIYGNPQMEDMGVAPF